MFFHIFKNIMFMSLAKLFIVVLLGYSELQIDFSRKNLLGKIMSIHLTQLICNNCVRDESSFITLSTDC